MWLYESGSTLRSGKAGRAAVASKAGCVMPSGADAPEGDVAAEPVQGKANSKPRASKADGFRKLLL